MNVMLWKEARNVMLWKKVSTAYVSLRGVPILICSESPISPIALIDPLHKGI